MAYSRWDSKDSWYIYWTVAPNDHKGPKYQTLSVTYCGGRQMMFPANRLLRNTQRCIDKCLASKAKVLARLGKDTSSDESRKEDSWFLKNCMA
ncbi:MAG: hypothetical protein HN929_12550, partial [Chloroflexi bacterium]|nr:hypothetical protein [Chloroflexota bacterium]